MFLVFPFFSLSRWRLWRRKKARSPRHIKEEKGEARPRRRRTKESHKLCPKKRPTLFASLSLFFNSRFAFFWGRLAAMGAAQRRGKKRGGRRTAQNHGSRRERAPKGKKKERDPHTTTTRSYRPRLGRWRIHEATSAGEGVAARPVRRRPSRRPKSWGPFWAAWQHSRARTPQGSTWPGRRWSLVARSRQQQKGKGRPPHRRRYPKRRTRGKKKKSLQKSASVPAIVPMNLFYLCHNNNNNNNNKKEKRV